ncbi:EI24 domain-containing protein [Polynucleobacter sp. IMCC30063]|uniref:EI24 domain-containing protein n=1 Tax=unclassified Polynucleobacter TaxID=2640945 RepID=UPI001F33B0D3|nr:MULTISPECIES: EI24 domain-containing protein [unclassified Polynucleobacter]MCE7506005.1 EI24 domain-containing protein [Polynucleobacter sp. IMCC30063]MCE7527169.1 EI24 domain-containing protein [Polynucleobacter sp. IMCC 30228]
MVGFSSVIRALGLALVGSMHPRMLWLSFRPFLMAAVFWGVLLWFAWSPALDYLRIFLSASIFTSWIEHALAWLGIEGSQTWLAPLFFIMLLMPVAAISLLLVIAFTTVPAIVNSVTEQPAYANLALPVGTRLFGGFFSGLVYTLWSSLICLVLVFLTLPIWWIPPLFAILPPLLWGWLTMRLMTYDVLAKHASTAERHAILEKYHWSLLVMGILAGLLGVVPSFFWATSVLALVLFPFVSFVALWVYSIIFVFAALWFSHFLLQALIELRSTSTVDVIEHDPLHG